MSRLPVEKWTRPKTRPTIQPTYSQSARHSEGSDAKPGKPKPERWLGTAIAGLTALNFLFAGALSYLSYEMTKTNNEGNRFIGQSNLDIKKIELQLARGARLNEYAKPYSQDRILVQSPRERFDYTLKAHLHHFAGEIRGGEHLPRLLRSRQYYCEANNEYKRNPGMGTLSVQILEAFKVLVACARTEHCDAALVYQLYGTDMHSAVDHFCALLIMLDVEAQQTDLDRPDTCDKRHFTSDYKLKSYYVRSLVVPTVQFLRTNDASVTFRCPILSSLH